MIHLIDNYYLTADNNSYTVGTARKKPDSRVILVGTRYFSLARAVSETAEIALRDKIAAGEITTLQTAVEELRNIKGQIQAAVSGKDVN